MRYAIGLLAAAVGAAAVSAADAKYALSGENTAITFVGTKPDGKHTGGFKEVSGTAAHAGDPTTLKIEIDVKTDSLYSDDPKLTGHLKSPDFFDVKTNPTAKFVSTKVEKAAAGYTVTGNLTLNGVTKPVSFPAEIADAGGVLKLTTPEFKLDRTQFGMTYGKGKIHDDVTLVVRVEAKK